MLKARRKPASQPPTPPPLFNLSVEHIITETQDLLKAKGVQNTIVTTITPETATFANTLLPLVQEENHRLHFRQLVEFLSNVSPKPDLQTACQTSQSQFSAFDTETASRNDLYELLASVRDKHEPLSSESSRLLEKSLLDFERNGLALCSSDRDRLHKLNTELEDLRRKYENSAREDHSDLWLPEADLDGLDQAFVRDLERRDDGMVHLPLSSNTEFSVLGSAKSQETRRKVYFASAEKFRGGVEVLERLIALRKEKARVMGFGSYNELRMVGCTETVPARVQEFLEGLGERMRGVRDGFLAKWRAMKREDLRAGGEEDDGRFYAWDRQYYLSRMLAEEYSVEGNVVSEYFELNESIGRMLGIFEKVFGLNFVEMGREERNVYGGDAPIWHEDVRMFAVWDDSDGKGKMEEFLGYLYMDMHHRPGKISGLSCLPIHPAFTDVDGSREYTSTALVCNYSKPTTTKPCLLAHVEVMLLFHELGHAMHDLVAKTSYARFHGASCEDFNEAPSQLLEQWCWHPATLRSMSHHYSTLSPEYMQTWLNEGGDANNKPTSLPDDLIEKLVHSKKASSIARTLGLLNASLFNLAVGGPDADHLNTTSLFHDLCHETFGVDIPDAPPPTQTSNVGLFTTDMYIYLTTQVYATDIFKAAFEKDPMDREQGLRYRRVVIGKGSSEDPMVMLREYLGRETGPEAYYEDLGVGVGDDGALAWMK